MGQRTQILLKLENKEGQTKNYLYHIQWGFCKVMPAVFMQWVINKQFFGMPTYYKDYNFFKENQIKTNDYIRDITSELKEYKNKNIDITNLNELKEILGGLDNNNGFMVIEYKELESEYFYKIGFIQGLEELKSIDDEFKEFVSPEKYMKESSQRCYNENFLISFEQFCKVYDIEILK